MQNRNENKIDETLNSIKGIARAEANAYTFEKVMVKMQNELLPAVKIRWSWVAAIALIVTINSGIVFYVTKTNTGDKENVYDDLGKEMGYTDEYNY